MESADPLERLVRRLAADLAPAPPLHRPGTRALYWLGIVTLLWTALATFGTRPPLWRDATAGALIWVNLAASILTAACAAIAAFELSLPGRTQRWALLPVIPLLLWLGTAGLGCLPALSSAAVWGRTVDEASECFYYLLGVAVPVSLLTWLMLQRARPLAPVTVFAMGGLASAAAAGSLLTVVHPHQSALLDLGVHALAFGIIIGANTAAAKA